jgi:Tfp pilus assembly protein PilF
MRNEELDEGVEADSETADRYLGEALYLQNLGRDEEARRYYESALELNEQDTDAHGNYAYLLVKLARVGQARFTDAERHFKRALELAPDDVVVLNNYAGFLAERGRVDEADNLHKRILELEGNSAFAHEQYAVFLAIHERAEEAEFHFKEALELPRTRPPVAVNFNYAEFLSDEGRFEEAEVYYKRALEFEPGLLSAQREFVSSIAGVDVDIADATYEARMVGVNESLFASIRRDYAAFLFKVGRLEEVEYNFKRSLELDEDPRTHLGYAKLLKALGREEEANKHFEKAGGIQDETAEGIY